MTLMYQNTTGELKAILAGQPVGRVIPAIAGMPEALQATALSKPTLARHPKGGKRNLSDFSASPQLNSFWAPTTSSSGVTATKVGYGTEDGLPYADYAVVGTATANAFLTLTQNSIGLSPAENMTVTASVRRIGGPSVLSGADGARILVMRLDAANSAFVTSAAASITVNNQETDITLNISGLKSPEPLAANLRARGEVRISSGVTVDATWRFKGFQSTALAVQTPLQLNYGPNDITEAGVPDLWHLYNDGGDSLNVALPNGTYTAAWVDTKGDVFFNDAVVVAGGVAQNILMAERICDVLFVRRVMTDAEKRELRAYWEARYKP